MGIFSLVEHISYTGEPKRFLDRISWAVPISGIMEKIVESLLASGSLTAILFLLLWTWFSKRLEKSIEDVYATKLETHKNELTKELETRKNELGKELETHKNNLTKETQGSITLLNDKLRKDTETELARLNAELQRVTAEQNVRFSHIFEKTSTAIATTHQTLTDLLLAVDHFVRFYGESNKTTNENLHNDVKQKWDTFYASFKYNKLYIRPSTVRKIQDFSDKLSALQSSTSYLRHLQGLGDTSQETLDRYSEEPKQLQAEIPRLLNELEDEFQEVLGVPMQKKIEELAKDAKSE
jgi:hypothetical protein